MRTLFHGSKHRFSRPILSKTHLHNKKVFYAACSKAFAISFIPAWNDNDIEHSTKNGKLYIKELKKDFLKNNFNTAGYLYSVDGTNFIQTPKIDGCEFIIETIPRVIKTEMITNVLSELKRNKDITITLFKG